MNIMQLCRPDPTLRRTRPTNSHIGRLCRSGNGTSPTWRLIALTFFLIPQVGILSCASLDSENKPFPIKKLESTRLKWIGERDSIAWLDNDRLLVAGYDPSIKDLGNDYLKFPPAGLYEWNLKTDELTLHSPLGEPWFCYAYGYMRYVVKKNGELSVKEGQYGQEEEKAFFAMPNMDRSTCKPYVKCPEGPRGGSLCPLPGGHGYVELGRDRIHSVNINPDPPNLWYYPTRDHPGIELPIAYHDAGWNGIFFSKYVNAYVIPQKYGVPGRKRPEKGRMWLLHRDGKTNEVLPPDATPHEAKFISPVNRGIYMVAGAFVAGRRPRDVGSAGGYLWNKDELIKVDSGFIVEVQVSPDGCHVATIVDPWRDDSKELELRVTEFCAR